MDIILVNGLFNANDMEFPYLGHLSLNQIIKGYYESEVINYDRLVKEGILEYTGDSIREIQDFSNYLISKNPKIVGFHTICSGFEFVVQVAKRVKLLNENIIIIFGGPHATMLAEESMEAFEFLDIVALGEGEKMILPLMNALMGKGDLKEVPNIVYRDNGKIIRNKVETLITNEELGKYTVFDFQPFYIGEDAEVFIEGGRGCPYNCTFCSTSSFWGRKFRIKPVDVIIGEMKKYNNLYGVKGFNICHDLFTADYKYISEFCKKIIEEKLPFTWVCSSRTDVLAFDIIDLMAEANCREIFLGIETGSQRMQKLTNKNLDLMKALEVIKYISERGIDITVSFIYGYPQETEEDFKETIKLIEELVFLDIKLIQLHCFEPYPKTLETSKIQEELYFDPNRIGKNFLDKVSLDDATKELVKANPKLFTSLYTFHSEVRDKYYKIENLICYMEIGKPIFTYALRDMVKNYGILNIYERYKDKIISIYEDKKLYGEKFQDIDEIILKFVDDIIYEEMMLIEDELKRDVYRYEHLLYEYSALEKKDIEVNRYIVDVYKARNEDVLVPKRCRIVFEIE